MKRLLGFLSLVVAALFGFGMGSGFFPRESSRSFTSGAKVIPGIHPERESPLTEFKSFAVILYAQNDADWCERSLRSIFSQDYDYFRLLFVDDGSSDTTLERARNFIIANAQQDRVIVMHNETPCGFSASMVRAVSHCLDREIVVPLSAKDWMASPTVLSHWNRAFQNPDVWMAFGRSIAYPSYEFREPPTFNLKEVEKKGWGEAASLLFKSHCFYSALFKQIAVKNLRADYLPSLLQLAGGRVKNVWEPICFVNETEGMSPVEPPHAVKSLKPLQAFPKNWGNEPFQVDVVVFSHNKPLGLLAALEAMERNCAGVGRITAMYWTEELFEPAYEQLRTSFPHVRFLAQGRELLNFNAVFETPAQYVLFATDDSIVKESIDLSRSAAYMDRVRADAFWFTSGKTEKAMALSDGVFAWDPGLEGKNGGLEMMLYRKSELASFLKAVRVQSLQDLSSAMKPYFPKDAVCLSFDESKSMHLNVGRAEELLSKFNQGLKIDLDSLCRGENPEFTPR